MKIGIKYCGGCNPRYDRAAAVEEIKKEAPDISFESLDMKKNYDKILLVCGCERTCLRFRPEFATEITQIAGSGEELRDIILG